MVKYKERAKAAELDVLFASLADPTRRAILRRLAKQPMTVSEIAKPYSMSLPAISKHLDVLEEAKLLRRTKQGRMRIVKINPKPLKQAAQHIEYYREFWEGKLDALQNYLEGGDTHG